MKFWRLVKKLVFIGVIAGAIISIIYFPFIRPWILRMGATDEEVKMYMPGDGLVISPSTKYTQAITIDAPKEVVWAYLIQLGYKRAGWYNWDFINRMAVKEYFYENDKSADRIIPELQNLKEGDKIYLMPQIGMDVSELKKQEYMLLTGYENDKYVVTWIYMVKEIDSDTTRLYVRWASDLGDGFMATAMNLLITEPGGVCIQQSQNLTGIKERAETEYLNRIK